MLTLLRILSGLLLLVCILIGVAYLLPREITVERDIVVEAPPEAVFPYVNSLKEMQAWNPWLDRDPDVQLTFDGPDAGVGARMSWQSEQRDVGSGSQEIVESVENERVISALDFGDMGTASASLSLSAEGNGTRVTWGLVSDMGNNPVMRWMGLAMDGMVGGDYEAGLTKLKALLDGAG
ncbi:SRPBCC family protein [Tropicimonas marinistellae]|uniref:SRPBCC family protein n=1 Tax=Tropicimonas marinistellae TaxID=1739787 RepID=UPI00082F3868|nr:SRPBCC family protein [Tropicimonas marinistellae]